MFAASLTMFVVSLLLPLSVQVAGAASSAQDQYRETVLPTANQAPTDEASATILAPESSVQSKTASAVSRQGSNNKTARERAAVTRLVNETNSLAATGVVGAELAQLMVIEKDGRGSLKAAVSADGSTVNIESATDPSLAKNPILVAASGSSISEPDLLGVPLAVTIGVALLMALALRFSLKRFVQHENEK